MNDFNKKNSDLEGGKEEEVELEWMWGDAGGVLHFISYSNPYRWEQGKASKIRESLESYHNIVRPIKLCIKGESYIHEFESPSSAVTWINSCLPQSTNENNLIISLVTDFAAFLAAPSLALFLRTNANNRSYWCRNVFVTGSYARRVTQVPLNLAALQHSHSSNPTYDTNNRINASWSEFSSSLPKYQLPFLQSATNPENDRPSSITISYRCHHNNNNNNDNEMGGEEEIWDRWIFDCDLPINEFMVIYVNKISKLAIVAYRGGDGGYHDAVSHIGSPARAFMQQQDENQIPELLLPLKQIQQLAEEEGYHVYVIGYSQGGIGALAIALYFASQKWFEKCCLLNCATMFWPSWMNKLLPKDELNSWWLEGLVNHPEWTKIESWVIRDDPLSDGIPGGKYTAPLVPGITKILPSCASGNNIMDNHSLIHFTNA